MFSLQYKTRNWVTTLTLLFFVIIFVVAFLLFCQTDLLNLDWIVPHGGVLWSGKITSIAQLDKLNARYHTNFAVEVINDGLLHGIRNIGKPLVSINILYLVLITFASTIFVVGILKLTRLGNWDLLVFTWSAHFAFIVGVFASLIPVWDRNNQFVRVLVIILIMLTGAMFSFLILNHFFINIVAHGKYSFDFARDIINEKNEIKSQDDAFKGLVKKKVEEKKYIEIEK